MAANYGSMLLNKVISANNPRELDKQRITADSFISKADKDAYEFIMQYADANRGEAPSWAVLVEEVPDFLYIPQVTDSFSYLAERVRKTRAEVGFMTAMEQSVPKLYEAYQDGEIELSDLLEQIKDNLSDIQEAATGSLRVGFDVKADTDEFMAEYRRRQIGESFTVWKSFLPFLNKATSGGYSTGNMYTLYGRSGRGKSVIALYEATNMAMQGATVLVWSLEMSTFETVARIYTFLSAMHGITEAEIDGVKYEAGFDANDMRNGTFEGDHEAEFQSMLSTINDHLEGRIIVRGSDDPSLRTRTVAQIRADIRDTNADVVLIDPFYYLDYEANRSKTTGGDAAETSRKLRILAGQESVVLIAITQADEDDSEKSNDGTREIKLPKRSEVKKTSQLLEDASLLIVVDTDYKQKLGRVGLNKGRNGGEGDSAEIVYIPHLGIVKESVIDASQFNF